MDIKLKEGSTVKVTEPDIEMTPLERAVAQLPSVYPNCAAYPHTDGTQVDVYQYDDQAGTLSHIVTVLDVVIE
jgi:hypothetical protein